MDTGIFPHQDFGKRIWGFADFIENRKIPYDDNGHGTHVTGILAGDGSASMGKHRGMAPGCGIVGLKVLIAMETGARRMF